MTAVIATWPFSLEPVSTCLARLLDDKRVSVTSAVVEAIRSVEADPDVPTVGAYSHPNANGVLQLDGALIEVSPGHHRCGAVMALEGYAGSIEGAFSVMEHSPHPILVGDGGRQFLEAHGHPPCADPVPTFSVQVHVDAAAAGDDGPKQHIKDHDTVGLIAVRDGVLTVGCSSSGKRGKLAGRVGDSPLFGSGLYAEGGVGGAVCTGDGDKICSFPLAFAVVTLMRSGHSPQDACVQAMQYLLTLPQGDAALEAAVVALNVHGDIGAACSPAYVSEFTFAAGSAACAPALHSCVCE